MLKAFMDLMHSIGTKLNEPKPGDKDYGWVYNKDMREYEYVGPELPKRPSYVTEPDTTYNGLYYLNVLKDKADYILVVSREEIAGAVEVDEDHDILSMNYLIRIVKAQYEALGKVRIESRL